jgi:hypothetical protein
VPDSGTRKGKSLEFRGLEVRRDKDVECIGQF